MSDEEIALKLTEIKFKNYEYDDYCSSGWDVIGYYQEALKKVQRTIERRQANET